MINRREAVFGLGCAAALGGAEFLRPRTLVTLLQKGQTLEALIPADFSGWTVAPGGAIVQPITPGSLADRLYSEQVMRSYRSTVAPERTVMLLVAYGGMQNDTLQLHRPEVCYPAVGFRITARSLVSIPIGGGAAVPAVALSAQSGDRIEDVLYWTRLGESFPQTAGQQRSARFRTAVDGYITDGVVARASIIRSGGGTGFETLSAFLAEMIDAVVPSGRSVLVGTGLARQVV